MKSYLFAFLALVLTTGTLSAQSRYMTRTGTITFFSHTPIEDIEATNNQVSSILDAGSGDMVFAVLMKSFQFEKALMQEHFNEKYVESDKFPKAQFKGSLTNLDAIDFGKPGTYPAQVTGKLTIHGVTQDVETEGTIVVTEGGVQAQAKFPITLADYDISIPAVVRDNIAKVVDITVEMNYDAMNP
ncbi:MAG: YceI family protein [Bacteroidetes bacterium]|nr:MAG: YceI family protein [Bacteroidota bacterium]